MRGRAVAVHGRAGQPPLQVAGSRTPRCSQVGLKDAEEARSFSEVVKVLSLAYIRAKRYRGPRKFVFYVWRSNTDEVIGDHLGDVEKAMGTCKGVDRPMSPGEYHAYSRRARMHQFHPMSLLEEAESSRRSRHQLRSQAGVGVKRRLARHAAMHRALVRSVDAKGDIVPLSPSELDARLFTLPRALQPVCIQSRRLLALAFAVDQTPEETKRLVEKALAQNGECKDDFRRKAQEQRKCVCALVCAFSRGCLGPHASLAPGARRFLTATRCWGWRSLA